MYSPKKRLRAHNKNRRLKKRGSSNIENSIDLKSESDQSDVEEERILKVRAEDGHRREKISKVRAEDGHRCEKIPKVRAEDSHRRVNDDNRSFTMHLVVPL